LRMADNDNPARRLTAAEARDKVTACRAMAARAISPEHRIMLEHMAETWERIAQSMGNGD
jgi:hypothetical protein